MDRSVALEAPLAGARGRLAFLDTLRFVAAAAVLAQHLFEGQSAPALRGIVALAPGVFGVVLFFIISSFVIPFSVKRGLDPAGFAVRRLFRIYPLALVAFAAAWAAGASGLIRFYAQAGAGSARAWIANLLLVNDYVGAPAFHGVTWTLSLELAWYALFAGMLTLFGARGGRMLAVAAPILFTGLALGSLLLSPANIYSGVLVHHRRWANRYEGAEGLFACIEGYYHHRGSTPPPATGPGTGPNPCASIREQSVSNRGKCLALLALTAI